MQRVKDKYEGQIGAMRREWERQGEEWEEKVERAGVEAEEWRRRGEKMERMEWERAREVEEKGK